MATQDTAQPLLYTVPEAARLLRLSERTIWAMVAGGDLPSLKIGRSRRIRWEDLQRFVTSQS